jgi:tetratricopeptide (TPR) repeat protein
MHATNTLNFAKKIGRIAKLVLILKVALLFVLSACDGQMNNQIACYSLRYPMSLKKYEGRYKLDDFNFLRVHYDRGNLLLKLLLWNSTQILQQVRQDSFVSEGHENLRYKFLLGVDGSVKGITLYGFQNESGHYEMIKGKKEPIELILSGNAEEGTSELFARHSRDTSTLVGLATSLNLSLCTKYLITEKYLKILSVHYSNYAPLYAALGNAYLLLGQRAKGIEAFKKSLNLDPNNQESVISLRLLHLETYPQNQIDSAFKLPFDLKALFEAPRPGEIKNIEMEWASRDLSVKDVIIADSGHLDLNGVHTTVYIVRHLVHGFKHFGAIVIPDNSFNAKKPAIIELKGVNPRYTPMNLNTGLSSYRFLCDYSDRFIYIVPSYRGEKLIFNGKEYLSEGNRADAMDGATDDVICLLNTAIKTFPQIDQNKIAAFGKSRGGTVALLAGIRDKRIKYVLDWAGPVDWFNLMNELGYTQQEFVSAGLALRSTPFQVGGQLIEWFLLKNIKGEDGLPGARKRMIASSPLYFLSKLPIVQAHYGTEDGIVPVANGLAIRRELNKRTKDKYQGVFFHPNVGHDLDPMIAFEKSRNFLLQVLH